VYKKLYSYVCLNGRSGRIFEEELGGVRRRVSEGEVINIHTNEGE
jgi:hypothetical protein